MFSKWDDKRIAEELAQGRFSLLFQPKIDLYSGSLTGAEALIRYHDRQGRMVMPGSFIPSLEEADLIGQMTRWVISEVIGFISNNIPPEQEGFRVSFNLSAVDLHDESLFDHLFGTLEGREYLMRHMIIEITESQTMKLDEHIIEKLSWLESMGMGISVDDFGTGYSSLQRLASIPFTEIKLDRSFIKRMLSSQRNAKIIDATVSLAHYMDLTTVAEGVESREEQDFLRSIGCEQAQGYLYAKPLPSDVLVACMNENYQFDGNEVPAGFIGQAILHHLRWYRNFVCNLRALHGSIDKGIKVELYFPTPEFDADACHLGKWLGTQRGYLKELGLLHLIDEPHRNLHRYADDLWREVVRGLDENEVPLRLREMRELSQRLVDSLYELEEAVFTARRVSSGRSAHT